MNNNYFVYHLHTELSLQDSCTNYKDYVDKAVELGMTSICFSEHGNIFNWIEKKMYCEEKGIKYVHGCEVYLTKTLEEKVRDNYHTILIAKNEKGVKELNSLMEIASSKSHKYYNNRISFDEFLNLSDNIIKISACLQSPLNKLDKNDEYYLKILKNYDYLEIQYHNMEDQINYNKELYEYSKKYNIPLITGTDTHSLNKYKAECRKILKRSKKNKYDNEDLCDLTFKSYYELVEMFDIQNSLPKEVILEAINNTNKLNDSIEPFKLDTSIKYPKFSDDDEKLFVDKIYTKLKDKMDRGVIPKDGAYLDELEEEIRVFKKLNMCSFMLSMESICDYCVKNDIPTGFCRGSVGGSLVAYILDIIDLDPIVWDTIFSRFCNEYRVEVGD